MKVYILVIILILSMLMMGCGYGRCFQQVYPKVPDYSGIEVYPKYHCLDENQCSLDWFPKLPECPECE